MIDKVTFYKTLPQSAAAVDDSAGVDVSISRIFTAKANADIADAVLAKQQTEAMLLNTNADFLALYILAKN